MTVGSKKEKYRAVRRLGEGAMGAVYEAEHRQLGTRVALKTLHAHLARNERFVDRFIREARAGARIRNRHVVRVIDVERTEEGAFIVMELVEGQPLDEWLETVGRLSTDEAIRLMQQLLEGVAAAHAAGVIHRDLKPANVMIAQSDEGAVLAKILDFGVAKLQDPETRALTDPGTIIGTPEYMPPEQASGLQADASADVFALGVLFYELLAGVHPAADVERARVPQVLGAGLYEPLGLLAPQVPEAVVAAIRQAMKADPEQRFGSAAAFQHALRGALAEASEDAAGELRRELAVAPTLPAGPGREEREPAVAEDDGAIGPAPREPEGREPPLNGASTPPMAADVERPSAGRLVGLGLVAGILGLTVLVIVSAQLYGLAAGDELQAQRVAPGLPSVAIPEAPAPARKGVSPESWPGGAARVEGRQGQYEISITYGRERDEAGRIPVRLVTRKRVNEDHEPRLLDEATLTFRHYRSHTGPVWRLAEPSAEPTFTTPLPEDAKYHLDGSVRTHEGQTLWFSCDICVGRGFSQCPKMSWRCTRSQR